MKKKLRLILALCIFNVLAMEDDKDQNQLNQKVEVIKKNFKVGNVLLKPISNKEPSNIEDFKEIYKQFSLNKHGYKFNPNIMVQKNLNSDNPWQSLYLAETKNKKVAVQFYSCPNIADPKNPFLKQIEAEYVKIGVGEYNKNNIYKPYESTCGHILPIIPDSNIDDNTASHFLDAFIRLGGYFAENGFITHNSKIVSGLAFYLNPNDRLVQILQAKKFAIVSPEGVEQDSWLCPNSTKIIMMYSMF